MTDVRLPACRNGTRHPDIWHSSDPEEQAEARAVCWGCPQRAACRMAALAIEAGWPAGGRHGIWGGLGGEERAALDPTVDTRAGRKLKPCGTDAAYRRHMRRGERIDWACREANRKQTAERAAARAAKIAA